MGHSGQRGLEPVTHDWRHFAATAMVGTWDISHRLRSTIFDVPGLPTRFPGRLVSRDQVLVGLAAGLCTWGTALVLLFHAPADLRADGARGRIRRPHRVDRRLSAGST